MNTLFNVYLAVLVTTMLLAFIGVPVPSLPEKRSKALSRRMGWANAAVVFAAALILAATR